MDTFYLGTHMVNWLCEANIPLFVSATRLIRYRHLPTAAERWALDSGAFTELNRHGCFTISAHDYASRVEDWSGAIGKMDWAAIQDWMCEPFMLAKTGKTVHYHQHRTIESYLYLSSAAPSIRWIPVLQGWTVNDYLRCVGMYADSGVNLRKCDTVGLGSVCRRQGTVEAEQIVSELSALGIRLHAFGFKLDGLRRCASRLKSADSMAWSFDARRGERLPSCWHGRFGDGNCANCLDYALLWYDKVMAATNKHTWMPKESGK